MRKHIAMLTPLIGWVAAALLVCLGLTPCAQGASFDCGKASTKVEHIICDNLEISKLDNELAQSYKAALQDQSKAEEIKQAQKQWLNERNECADTACVKVAYENRLSTFASLQVSRGSAVAITTSPTPGDAAPHNKPKEADKKETIKSIMSKVEITHFAEEFCEGFLADFRRMENLEFVEPIERSEKFDDPIWNSYQEHCPNMGLFDNYICDARTAMYLDGLPQNEQNKEMKRSCDQYRCTENFKHFRLKLKEDEGGRTEDIFYCERARGPRNRRGGGAIRYVWRLYSRRTEPMSISTRHADPGSIQL